MKEGFSDEVLEKVSSKCFILCLLGQGRRVRLEEGSEHPTPSGTLVGREVPVCVGGGE